MTLDLRRIAESAWLVTEPDPERLDILAGALAVARPAGVRDVVPGARTLLVVLDEPGVFGADALVRLLAGAADMERMAPRTIEVAVRYDGADLAGVGARAGLTVDEVVARHAGAEYRVAFLGFQPGFAYLRGLPPELVTPRLSSPRPRVPAGSVAIGAGWTGIYPAVTPGGWNLIGTTDPDLRLFDPYAERPALLAPGDRVRFVPA